MDNSIIIKGGKNGITLVLDKNLSFEDNCEKIRSKFESAAKFFNNTNLAITFEGKELTDEEEMKLLDIISEVSDINIVCVINNNNELEKIREDAVKKALSSLDTQEKKSDCLFYKGTLRSGQIFESDGSVIILGDVNPGGKVVAKGNVIILGTLRGIVFAGVDGNVNSFVVALDMDPMQIKIADVIARSSETGAAKISKGKVKVMEPKIAYVYDQNIYIENIEQNALEDVIV